VGRPWLGQLLTYVSTVYGIGKKIKMAKDERKKPQILASTVFCIVLLGFLFRMESFNQLNGWIRVGRFRKLLPKGTRVPFIDAIRESLSTYELSVLYEAHREIIQTARRNKVFQQGTIGGWVVVGLDGVELFESTKKCCDQCLTREKEGITHYFHRGVGCMSVGSDPHILLGIEHLHPKQDGSDKDEGELTGSKRLLRRLHKEFHHFADVIVADALYANAPFVQEVKSIGMDAVIRIKNTRLNVVKDALGLFKGRTADRQWEVSDTAPKANRKKQRGRRVSVQAWDEEGFKMTGLDDPIRFIRFVETVTETVFFGGKPKPVTVVKEVWVITTLGRHVTAEVIWKMIHARWDIENNGFRELKTKWHIDHCFMHEPRAIEAIVMFIVLAFNLFQLYLFRRVQGFRELRITQSLVVEELRIQAVASVKPLHHLLE
jgi:Transposase DDE domain